MMVPALQAVLEELNKLTSDQDKLEVLKKEINVGQEEVKVGISAW
jgi:hypothetical protein